MLVRFLANRWGFTEFVVWDETNSIDFYNILKYTGSGMTGNEYTSPRSKAGTSFNIDPILYNVHLAPFETDPLDELMNGPIREKLGIIPTNVTWGGQSDDVFSYHEEEFMKPVIDVLDKILNETTLNLIIYQGSLDLICLTKGAMNIVNKMTWPGIPGYMNSTKTALTDPDRPGQTELFVKAHNNFKFYWVINAGHMVPKDYPTAARRMLLRIVFNID
ncbi:hypothetical protein LSH36_1793g00009 [Paralvinella palmiformis]|uniref:Serine carboxypeptidase n=1 Tax=Paralvinella palmiformis TaxID=53620 RepID=A0AAD9MPH8_9ANNE|nr:hypothetical protein LSH36_1793g00009 [Paralvinella palmiformis]